VWLLGVVCLTVYHTLGYGLFRKRLLRWSVPAGESAAGAVYARLAQEMGIQKPPCLRISHRAAGPLLIGLLRPVIVLPGGDADETETRLILRHELTHHRRRDVWYKLMLLTVGVLHWFNPFTYLMRRAAEEDLELVCDRETTREQSLAEKQAYGGIILKMASEKRIHSAVSTSFPGTVKTLRRRLENLLAGRKKLGVIPFCAFLLLVGMMGTLIACQPISPARAGAEETPTSDITNAVHGSDDVTPSASLEPSTPSAPSLSAVAVDVPVNAERSEFPRKLSTLDEDIVKETVRQDIEDFFDINLAGIPVSIQDMSEFVNEGTPKQTVVFFSEARNVLYDATIEVETQTIIELDSLGEWAKTAADADKSGDYIAAAAEIARSKLSLLPDNAKAICYLPMGAGKTIDNLVVCVVFPDDLFYVEVSVADLSPVGYRFFLDAAGLDAYLAKHTALL
jgi:hypothetical protein